MSFKAVNYPALQLVWSPTGMGSVVHGRSWPVGGVEPISGGLAFGIEGDVRVRYPIEPKTFCRIDQRDGRLRLWHFRDLFHCAVNGRACEDGERSLRHRDLIG